MEQINELKKIDSLDFRNNKKHLIISYLIRLLGLLIFGFILFSFAEYYYNPKQITFKDLVEIKIQSYPAIVSIILVTLNVFFVLFVHELIHACVFYVTHKQLPKIGIRGLVIFAAAPNKILNKTHLIVNAFTPFLVITLIGIFMMSLIPISYASWIFIPTLVNAGSSGGDFMAIIWAFRQPKGSKFIDYGDIINAYTTKQKITNEN